MRRIDDQRDAAGVEDVYDTETSAATWHVRVELEGALDGARRGLRDDRGRVTATNRLERFAR
jgi:hypothetical protein